MSKKLTTSEFILRAARVHGNTYKYTKTVYVDASTKVVITCRLHGDFFQTPSAHINNAATCRKCADKTNSDRARSKFDFRTKEFLSLAKLTHGTTYDYSKSKYLGANTKIQITCKVHGNFLTLPHVHLKGHGCLKCANSAREGAFKFTTEQIVAKAKAVHGNRYDYRLLNYKGRDAAVVIVCSKHGEFTQSPMSHLGGHGCSLCSRNGYSKKAISWIQREAYSRRMKNVLHAENGGEFTIPGTRMHVDGYHHATKTVFEFHGNCFHGNLDKYKPRSRPNPFSSKTAKRLYNDTLDRDTKIRSLGYRLITIWELDYDRDRRS